jgi:8-oxo-dGTP diphosphatase
MTYKPSSKQEEQFLKSYDASEYQNPALAADVALFAVDDAQLKLLLIERGGFPYKGCWALPGGFVNIDEDIADAAKRELMEETGIGVPYIEQAAVWGKPNRDPRQRVVTVSFIALADFGAIKAKAGDDAAAAEWFTITEYAKSIGKIDTRISYTLVGTANISADVGFVNERIQEITAEKSGGLAFDHAESIAVSIELLKKRAEIIAPLCLNKEKAADAVGAILKL